MLIRPIDCNCQGINKENRLERIIFYFSEILLGLNYVTVAWFINNEIVIIKKKFIIFCLISHGQFENY